MVWAMLYISSNKTSWELSDVEVEPFLAQKNFTMVQTGVPSTEMGCLWSF